MSPDNVEFALFETPLDKKGSKIRIDDPEMAAKQVQPYFDDIEEFKTYHSKKAQPATQADQEDDKVSSDTKSSDEGEGVKVDQDKVTFQEEVLSPSKVEEH